MDADFHRRDIELMYECPCKLLSLALQFQHIITTFGEERLVPHNTVLLPTTCVDVLSRVETLPARGFEGNYEARRCKESPKYFRPQSMVLARRKLVQSRETTKCFLIEGR